MGPSPGSTEPLQTNTQNCAYQNALKFHSFTPLIVTPIRSPSGADLNRTAPRIRTPIRVPENLCKDLSTDKRLRQVFPTLGRGKKDRYYRVVEKKSSAIFITRKYLFPTLGRGKKDRYYRVVEKKSSAIFITRKYF